MRAWGRHAQADIAVAIAASALFFAVPRGSRRFIFGDSIAYMRWPSEFVYDGFRVMGARPPIYPLLLKMVGTDTTLVYVQTLLSFAAWPWLGWVVGRLPGAVVGTSFALMPVVWRWNVCILTESVSLSLMALCLGLALHMARRAARDERLSWTWLAGFALCVWNFAWLRDSNLLIVPAFLLPAFYGAMRQRCAVALVVVAAVGVGWVNSQANDRTQFSLDNAIIGRVLIDREATERFAAGGMPLSPALREAAGKPRRSTQKALRTASPEFSSWSAEHGASMYWRWVLSRPSSYGSVWRAAGAYHAADLGVYPSRVRFPPLVGAARSLEPLGRASWTLLLLAVLMGAAALERAASVELAMAGVAFGTALLVLFVTYHADAAEVHRHMVAGLVLQRAAFFIGLAALAGILWRRFERRRSAN